MRRVKIIHVVSVAWTGDRQIGRVFIRPRRISTRSVNDAKDGVGAHKVPREYWIAILITRQAKRIYGCAAAIRGARTDAVEEALIVTNSFFVLCPCAAWCGADRAGPAGNTVATGNFGRIERTVISHIIKNSFGASRSAAHQGR